MQSSLFTKVALPCAVLFAAVTGVFADDHDKKTDVTIDQPVEVPGGVVLQPGKYMFKLMEATGNRHIVQISSEDGKKTFAIVMTAAARRTEPSSKTILTFYEMPSGSPEAVKRWFWPSDLDGQEFLYPRDRAAQISKLTNEKVPEAPEGQPLIDNSTQVSQTETPAAATPAPEVVAQANEPAPVNPAPPVDTAPVQTAPVQTAPVQTAQAQPEPVAPAPAAVPDSSPAPAQSSDSTLPQTASDMPLYTLIGVSAIGAAALLRRARRA